MAIKSQRISVTVGTAVALLVQGAAAGQFYNITGSATDTLPVQIKNTDAANPIDIGGSGVLAGAGYPLLAGQSITMSLLGSGDIPYAIATGGTVAVAVMVGRQ